MRVDHDAASAVGLQSSFVCVDLPVHVEPFPPSFIRQQPVRAWEFSLFQARSQRRSSTNDTLFGGSSKARGEGCMRTKRIEAGRIVIVAMMAGGAAFVACGRNQKAHCTYRAGAAGRPGLDIVADSLGRHHGG